MHLECIITIRKKTLVLNSRRSLFTRMRKKSRGPNVTRVFNNASIFLFTCLRVFTLIRSLKLLFIYCFMSILCNIFMASIKICILTERLPRTEIRTLVFPALSGKVGDLPSHQMLWFLANIYLDPGFKPLLSQRCQVKLVIWPCINCYGS